MSNEPADPALFDEDARRLAAKHHLDSPWRWLVLSPDPEARGLRAALEHCWRLAGPRRDVLAKGLAHERWGQHVGARAHLLALGLFAHEGFEVTAEPRLDGLAPDLVARRAGAALLVEVRAMTGCGLQPWERADLDEPTPEELAAVLAPATPRGAGATAPAREEDAEGEADTDDGIDAVAEAEAETETETVAEPVAEPEAEPVAVAEAVAEAEAEADTEADTETDTDTDTEAGTEPDTAADTEAAADTHAERDLDTDRALRHVPADVSPPPLDGARRAPAAGGGSPVFRRRRSRAAGTRDARARARRRASERAAAERAVQQDLRVSLARVLEQKAAAYRKLCEGQDLPYVICLYQDTDRSLGALVREWAFGDPRQPALGPGALLADDGHLDHVSAVIVFGRGSAAGQAHLWGEIVLHPGARRPLPAAARLPHLQARAPRQDVSASTPQSFALVPIDD